MTAAGEITERHLEALLSSLPGAGDVERSEIEDLIVAQCARFVTSLARRYHGRGVATDDLEQVAFLALVKALRGFDPAHGQFLAYAKATIQGELKKHFRDHAWMVRPTRCIQELQPRVVKFEAEFAQESDRNPNVAEIATALDVEPSLVVEAKTARGCFTPVSFDAPRGEDRQVGDTLAAPGDDFDTVDVMSSIAPIVRELDDDDRELLRLRFVDDLTQQQIADELGITQMQVSRRLKRILERIRTAYDAPGLPAAA